MANFTAQQKATRISVIKIILNNSLYQLQYTSNFTVNFIGHENACGFYPFYWGLFTRYLYPITFIKIDGITLKELRDVNGLCMMAGPGDVGQIAGQILATDPVSQFVGYVNKEETSRKIIENVFKKGDKAFISGDLLQMDENGFLYFRDRIGDTYRWKGK